MLIFVKTTEMKSKLTLTAIIKVSEAGKFIGHIQEFPEVLSQGDTISELLENLQDAFGLLMESNRKKIIRNALKEKAILSDENSLLPEELVLPKN